ncbi:hypothetical protein SELMODRAFT_100130 [Selaginella moellendorffii]|uniref:5' exonuclease Apollo n=1 Tax=Selaginella moellendorffii TaxID=88036 RepID=D8RSX0_SELML|nr:5' exonuclease Apollo [Selaginella moellendorffii]EFJ25145.1 hypothetical protein SELMODRAFT_100130 [Selaginella moellendorffii]|eukprot:XP_002974190.1 5' exonuclease Apollo [Selaginella moellendorffii]
MRRRFVVDEWRSPSDAYFLTHLHADHTEGLSADWCRGPLYCSQVTAMLLLARFKGFNPALLHILDLGTPTLVSSNNAADSLLEVTAIDADHCPGAVMYVFHGEFGCVLHTGDFRWNNDRCTLEERKEALREAIGGAQVDFLYLDNTFCNPLFCFPSRNAAATRVIELIRGHPEKDIVIGIDNLGKEELLLSIAQALETKICVWPQRLKTMHLLQLPDVFTTDTSITRIRAVPRCSVSTRSLKLLNEIRPTLGILPTGCLCLCNPSSGRKPKPKLLCSESCYKSRERTSDNQAADASSRLINVVPYSLHCCFSEARDFVDLIRPKSVLGIVKSSTDYSINPIQLLSGCQATTSTTAASLREGPRVLLDTRPDLDCSHKLRDLLQVRCSSTKLRRRKNLSRRRQRLHGRGAKLYEEG